MKKKLILIIIILAILILTASLFAYFKFARKPKAKPEAGEPADVQVETINELEVVKRPYVILAPREDGKELFLTISNLKMGETNVEYELEYQAGTMIQGVFGRIDFAQDNPPATKKLLLGSCSKGKCKYDEDVSGGTLTLRFSGTKDYVLREDFTLNLMFEKEGVFALRNAKVGLDVGSSGLSASTYVVAMSSFGLPVEVEGELVAGPIGFFTANPAVLKKEATLTFKGVEETEGLKAYGLVKDGWQEFEDVEVEDNSVSVVVNQLTTFILSVFRDVP